MRHIFLIGLSGSGKSTVSRIVAERLGKPFVDTDILVEQAYGESISALFAEHGEQFFRASESQMLEKAIQTPEGAVIATGGGIVVRPENRFLMAEHGTRIFLSVEPEEALARLKAQYESLVARGNTAEIHPLLAGSDPLCALRVLLSGCSSWYEEVDYIISTQGKSAERVAQEVLALLVSSSMLDSVLPVTRHIQVGEGYDTIVDWGGLGRLPEYLAELHLPPRLFLLTDGHVGSLYAPPLLARLQQVGFDPYLFTIPAGEASKSQQQLMAIYDWLIEHHAERREAIVALGGGMIGDLAGFAAATYLRGVPLIQVPTSLLAQVDAAIGGKTGINHPRGKNLIGAFYHPRLVLADPATLLTLPIRERTEGWAEVVKYGIILDAELFVRLEMHTENLRTFSPPPVAFLCQVIARCIELKAMIVEEDEREQERRAILNYGHTIAHALENVAGYGQWLHGEAVSLGMAAAAALAEQAGWMPPTDVARQNDLLVALGLPIIYRGTISAQDILSTMQLDKKVMGKRIRWVMPQRIGEVMVTPLPDELVQSIVRRFFG